MKRGQKAGFLGPRSSKITVTKSWRGEKERARRRKGGEEKKAMVTVLVFIIATLVDATIFFGQIKNSKVAIFKN